jgi:hypothetical protein
MSERKTLPADMGPDLLARYLNVYMQSRQMSDTERPWGLGDDGLDAVWIRLTNALSGDAQRVNEIIATELSNTERARVIETLAPLLFAIPLRNYPAELRAIEYGEHLLLILRHADGVQPVGHLPSALAPVFAEFLKRVLHFTNKQRRMEAVISSGGRRRRVSVSLLGHDRVAAIRFLERLPSPAEDQ